LCGWEIYWEVNGTWSGWALLDCKGKEAWLLGRRFKTCSYGEGRPQACWRWNTVEGGGGNDDLVVTGRRSQGMGKGLKKGAVTARVVSCKPLFALGFPVGKGERRGDNCPVARHTRHGQDRAQLFSRLGNVCVLLNTAVWGLGGANRRQRPTQSAYLLQLASLHMARLSASLVT